MHFAVLVRLRKKPTKEFIAQYQKWMETGAREGVRSLGIYWTLGRFDAVGIFEAPSEKAVMKHFMRLGEHVSTETLVAVPAEEAAKLVE